MEEMSMNQYDSLYGVLSIANSFLTHVSSDNDEVMCPGDASGGGNIIHHSYTDQQNIHEVEERIPTLQADYDVVVCSSATGGGGNGFHQYTDQQNIHEVEERIPTLQADYDVVVCSSATGGGGNGFHQYTDQQNIHEVEELIPTLQADYDQVVCSSATRGGGNGLHPYTDQHNIDKVEERTLPLYQDKEVHRIVITPETNESNDKGLQWSGPRAHQRVQCQPCLNQNQNSHHSWPHSVDSTPMFSFTQNIIYNPVQQTYNPVQQTYNPVQQTYNPVQQTYNTVQQTYNPVQQTYNPVQQTYNPVQQTYNPVQHAFNPVQHAYNPMRHAYNPLQHTREPNHDPAFYSWTSNNSFQNRLDNSAGYGCMSTLQHIDTTRNPSLDVPGTVNFSANSLGLPQNSIEQHNNWEPERGEPSQKSPAMAKPFEKEESSSMKNPNHLSPTSYVPDLSTRFIQINTTKTLRYECSVCHLQISNCTGLKHHMKTHGSGWKQTTVICAICGEVASDLLKMNKHLESHPQMHGDLPQRRASKVQRNEKGRYECHICDKAFCKRDTHKEHMRVHTGEMPFECNFCKRQYRAQGAYAQHMKTHNTMEGHN